MKKLPEITWYPEIELKFDWFSKSYDDEELTNASLEDCLDTLDEAIAAGGIIKVTAYNRDMPTRGELEFLPDLMERIDETRTRNDGDWQANYITGGLEKLKAAEQAFIDLFLANYDPWGCVPAATILVPVEEWLKHTGEKP